METAAADRSVALPICMMGPEPEELCTKLLLVHDHRFVVLPTSIIGPVDLTFIVFPSNDIRDVVMVVPDTSYAVFVEPTADVIVPLDDMLQFVIFSCMALDPPPNKMVGTV